MSTLPTNLADKLVKVGATQVRPDDELRVYRSYIPNCKYAFKDGTEGEFIKGYFYTKREAQIDELDEMIAMGHKVFYVDPNEMTIVAEDRDPNVKLKKKLRAELLAEGYVKVDPSNDMGNSNQGNFTPANTRDMAAVTAGGDGRNSGAQLADLVQQIQKGKVATTQPAEEKTAVGEALSEAAQKAAEESPQPESKEPAKDPAAKSNGPTFPKAK